MITFAAKSSPEVLKHLRRIVDLTVPNQSPGAINDRVETRSNRAIPALLCPWENGLPRADEHVFVVTKDLSSDGIGIVLPQPFRAHKVLLGFWLNDEVMDEPWLFLGTTQNLQKLGGGFWTLGVQLTEFLTKNQQQKCASLAPLLARLRA